MVPRGVDAAGGDRRHDARGIAGQDRAVPRQRLYRPAARDQPGAGVARLQLARQPAGHADPEQEAVDVGDARVRGIVAQGQPGLHAAGVLRQPADVAGRIALADEAMQGIGIGQARAGEFVFDAVQELADLAQPAASRDPRTRAIGADQVARAAHAVHLPAGIGAFGIGEGLAQPKVDRVRLQLRGQPAHHGGRVGGEEVVARRGQRDLTQARGVQAHRFDAPGHAWRQPVQQGVLGGFLDDDPGGAQLVAGIALAFEHADPQPALRRCQGAGGTGEARAHHHHVEIGIGIGAARIHGRGRGSRGRQHPHGLRGLDGGGVKRV